MSDYEHRNQTSDQSTWLLFNGLDTFSTIELCGQMVASTNNQFRQYYFDVSDILDACSGTPSISINFGSAPNIATELAEAPGAETWPVGVELSVRSLIISVRPSRTPANPGTFNRRHTLTGIHSTSFRTGSSSAKSSPILAGTGVPRLRQQEYGSQLM